MRKRDVPFSVYGVPLLGLAGLLVCLWHPQGLTAANGGSEIGSEMLYLVHPSSRLDKSMTVFLKQEAKNVAYSRRHDGPVMQAKTVADYNMIAEECTPAVFEKTHLPPAMVF